MAQAHRVHSSERMKIIRSTILGVNVSPLMVSLEPLQRSEALKLLERLERTDPRDLIAIILFQTCSLLDRTQLLLSQAMVTFSVEAVMARKR